MSFSITPLYIKKKSSSGNGSASAVSPSNDDSAGISSNKIPIVADAYTEVDLSLWNPYRRHKKIYNLVIRKDYKLCPKQVARCEKCKIGFEDHDMAVIKTTGMRERADKKGKLIKYHANIYLHFLTECPKSHEKKFSI